MVQPVTRPRGPVWIKCDEQSLGRDQIVQSIKAEVARRITNENMDVPMLPAVAADAMALIKNPKAGINDVSGIIEKDQYLAARLIKIANSPLYRSMYEVTNITRAVSLIGLRGVTELIFTLSIKGAIFTSEVFAERMERLWQHSVGCAFLAQEIGRTHGGNAENFFLMGLLHDIGKPMIIDTVTKLVQRQSGKFPSDVVTVELVEEIMNEFHVRVGGLIGNKWAFPENLMNAINSHHSPIREGRTNQGALLTGIADLFAHQFGLGVDPDGKDISGHPWIVAFGITAEDYRDIQHNLAGNAKMIAFNIFSDAG
jgi:putative nucleotidyltransferase with HDIG domain